MMNSKCALLKKIILSILVCYSWIFSADINIAFVHLGPSIPSYLKYALMQSRVFNPLAEIFLICDKPAYAGCEYCQEMCDSDIKIVYTDDLPLTHNHYKIKTIYNPYPNFRDGYWAKTVERFYVLEELMRRYSIEDLFHFESDVLIYYDLSEHIDIFRSKYLGITGTLRSHDHCAPCFVYIRNVDKLAHYLHFLTLEGIKNPTLESLDMHVPIKYRKKFGKEYMGFLPLVPFEYTQYHSFMAGESIKAANQDWYCEHAQDFDSVFDAALFGFFTGGVDHRNRGPGFDHGPGTIFSGALFDVGKFKFEWIKDGCNRTIPYIEFMGKKYRVNNLHVNSKDLDQFISY